MFKITKKDVKNSYNTIFCCGYCNAQHLEKVLRLRRIAYNSGAYGWNYHVLEVTPDVCILTGYSGTFGVNLDGKELRDLDARARQIIHAEGNNNAEEEIEKLKNDFFAFLEKAKGK